MDAESSTESEPKSSSKVQTIRERFMITFMAIFNRLSRITTNLSKGERSNKKSKFTGIIKWTKALLNALVSVAKFMIATLVIIRVFLVFVTKYGKTVVSKVRTE
ncbi:hypothetical protein GJ496_006310 [Pomphorhynchus laevis]|nr:hypothetical protein GJ496_006310 [Pomphorhynchus laevis]